MIDINDIEINNKIFRDFNETLLSDTSNVVLVTNDIMDSH